jgi:hypothetical protein
MKALLDINGKTDIKSSMTGLCHAFFLGINGEARNIFATGLINAKIEKL